MIYSGVGARKTPLEILNIMYAFAFEASQQGHVLRSGGAIGADDAFGNGAKDGGTLPEIFTVLSGDATQQKWWMDYSAALHPAWDKCGQYARQLHARNVPIVLGSTLTEHSDFVVCWSPNAAIIGGTGQTIRIAHYNHIEVLNLARPNDIDKLWGKLK